MILQAPVLCSTIAAGRALFQHRHHDFVVVATFLFDKTYVIARKLTTVADRDVELQNSENFRKIYNYYPLRGIFKEKPLVDLVYNVPLYHFTCTLKKC